MTSTEIATADKIILGSTEAEAMYIGSTLIWQAQTQQLYDAEVEYIECTGSQYINTLFYPSNKPVTVETSIAITSTSQNSTILGAIDDNASLLRFYPIGFDKGKFYSCNFSGSWNQNNVAESQTITKDVFYNVTSSIGSSVVLTVDSTSSTKSRYDGFNSSKPLYLFARNGTGISSYASCKMKYMKIYEDDVLVRNFVPVRVGQTGYLYDKVTKTLFGNQGNGSAFSFGQDRIPYDMELEYLQADGTQYINTGIINNSSVIIDMKMSASGTNCLHGSEYTYQYRFKWGADGNGYIYYGYQNNHTSGVTFQLDQPCTYYLKQGEQYVKDYQGNTILSSSETLSAYSTNPIMLFKCYSGSDWVNTSGTVRIYSCKIYNNGVLMDLIPVRKGQIGYLYDKVSGQLFANAGSGSFILGPDRCPYGYTKLEYISSTSGGNQYIDLDIKLYEVLNTDYDIAMKFNMSTTQTESQATMFSNQDPNTSPWPGVFIRRETNKNRIQGRYIGGTAKDNYFSTLGTITELPVQTPPNKNVTNIYNNNKTHTYGTSLFCGFSNTSNSPQRFCNATLYYFKLFVNGALVRDMIPCKNSNNVVGLYDVVNNTFYTSPNGAAFVAGPEV